MLIELATILFCICVLVFSFHWYLVFHRPPVLPFVNRVLLVTAHPDDETLFFAPTLLGLRRQGCQLYLLCLSSGNFYPDQGQCRKEELFLATKCLGLNQSHVTIIEHDQLVDGPEVHWKASLIGELVLRTVMTFDIDTLITFDQFGVSGHANHIALHSAVQVLYSRGYLPNTRTWLLESVSMMRKYSCICDLGLSYSTSEFVFVSSWSEFLVALKAMCMHRSQLVWYRVLYVLFSRYMLVNTLKSITLHRRPN